MPKDVARYKEFSRRALMLGGGQLALVSALVGRMYYLQVVQSDQYQMLAEENRISLRLIAPRRGLIVDRFGQQMASNRLDYRISVIPDQTKDFEATLASLKAIFPLEDRDIARALKAARTQRAFLPVTVADNLDWNQFAAVNVNSPDLPGVATDVAQTRYYPEGPTVAHVVGYVGAVTERDLEHDETNDPLLQLPAFRIGKNGLEQTYDTQLRGKAGATRVEVNAYGRVIRELDRNEGTPGDKLQLTIDMHLQRFATEKLGDQSGSAVVLDIHSGEILAMASTPAYNPNDFNVGISHAKWKDLLEDPHRPLWNKPVRGNYPPGSTFKMITALAGLEAGVIDPDTAVFCNGSISMGSHQFHCWKKGGHGSVNVVSGLARSCDVFFYEVARRAGIDRIADMARRFGLGSPFGIGIPGEEDGFIPTPAWKRKRYKQPWYPGETLVNGIGQGYVTATPLQLAVMAARIANGGMAVTPRLVLAAGGTPISPPATPASLGVSDATLDVVRRAMAAVAEPGGTAYGVRIQEAGLEMAAKTGTAQVHRITKAERDSGVIPQEQLPWVQRDHALFVCFAPVSAPRYAASVVVEHGGHGASAAGPVARDLLLETMRRNPGGHDLPAPKRDVQI